jgi:ArsR family transcriptional regulator, arsenate/arsenite/antimonite-responsive transcriptional repressor
MGRRGRIWLASLPARCIISMFPETLKESAVQQAYRSLADPHRRTILKILRRGERTAGELATATGLRPAALTHHLTVLKLADLVRVERRRQYQVYSLNTTVFQDLIAELLGWVTESTPEEASGSQTGDAP